MSAAGSRSTAPLRQVGHSYGLLAVVAVGLIVLTALVTPLDPQGGELATSDPGSIGSPAGPVPGATGSPAAPGAAATEGGTVSGTAGADPDGPEGRDGGTGGDVPAIAGCPDRPAQLPGDPYSPPCVAFSGDNGGATSRGVTSDEIVVTFRVFQGPQVAEVFAQLAGQRISDSRAALRDTVQAYADYLNERFQFYGRHIRIEIFDGQGSAAAEVLGGGKERALADSTTASQQYGAFADVSAFSGPYADALTQQQVVNIGAPYLSSNWFAERVPYAWSHFPDTSGLARSVAAWVTARLAGQPADHAGGSLQGKPRSFALVAPENREYQEGVDEARAAFAAAGVPIARDVRYQLDLNTMSNQAASIIAQLKDAGVTSVMCLCDPVMLALGMTPKANEQSYQPEWISAGVAFGDLDTVGQLFAGDQWQHAFGIASNGNPAPQAASLAYAAYKAERPNGEPVGFATLYYEPLYILALGIQLAGPNLTPETFQQGLYSYPGGAGPLGSWHFGPGDHTGVDDFREVWWDANRTSPENGKPGTWVSVDGGARRTPETVPRGQGPFFR